MNFLRTIYNQFFGNFILHTIRNQPFLKFYFTHYMYPTFFWFFLRTICNQLFENFLHAIRNQPFLKFNFTHYMYPTFFWIFFTHVYVTKFLKIFYTLYVTNLFWNFILRVICNQPFFEILFYALYVSNFFLKFYFTQCMLPTFF